MQQNTEEDYAALLDAKLEEPSVKFSDCVKLYRDESGTGICQGIHQTESLLMNQCKHPKAKEVLAEWLDYRANLTTHRVASSF